MKSIAYPGSKGADGVWQTILNNIPPHDTWIEAFAGSAVITRRKKLAGCSLVIDSDADVCRGLVESFGGRDEGQAAFAFGRPDLDNSGQTAARGVTVICDDAIRWLTRNKAKLNERTVVYCDPPYLFATRTGGRRRRYGHEFGEEYLHGELLAGLLKLSALKVKILISGYRHGLYDAMLDAWRRVDYGVSAHGSPRTESLWCNFAEPGELHDYRVVGGDFRERERLKRKRQRWVARLHRMPALERSVLLSAIDEWRAAALA